MSQLCYGWMKFKVESGSPTKTPKKHRSVCISCFISTLVESAGGEVLRILELSLTKIERCRGNSLLVGESRHLLNYSSNNSLLG